MESGRGTSIMDHFQDLEDPRIERSKRHQLLDIVAIAICAVINSAGLLARTLSLDFYTPMAQFLGAIDRPLINDNWARCCSSFFPVHYHFLASLLDYSGKRSSSLSGTSGGKWQYFQKFPQEDSIPERKGLIRTPVLGTEIVEEEAVPE